MNYAHWADEIIEKSSRFLAARTSRRSLLAKLGVGLVGVGFLPLLPVSRLQAQTTEPASDAKPGEKWDDPKSCDYWAYCATAGWLCTTCGGSSSQCPPGSEMSPIAWVGTCKNPGDGKNYVVSYHDCCGMSQCGSVICERSEGATARYRMQRSNSVTWCFGGVSSTYHCTVSRLLSVAE